MTPRPFRNSHRSMKKSHRRHAVRRTKKNGSARPVRLEKLEDRHLLAVGPSLLAVQANDGTLIESGDVRNSAPRELRLYFEGGSDLNAASLASGIRITRTGFDGVFDGPAGDVLITPGFIGLGDTNSVVIVRFAEPLPDDDYRITIFGAGSATPLTDVNGNPFDDADGDADGDRIISFSLDLGAQVVAVVPQPISRVAGELSQAFDQIVVYFNEDDLNPTSAENPAFYQLINTQGTSNTLDDTFVLPTNVDYDPATNKATLTFAAGAIQAEMYRLRVGTEFTSDLAPTTFNPANDNNSSFATATPVGFGATPFAPLVISSQIQPQPIAMRPEPGGLDEPGHRQIPPEAHYGSTGVNPVAPNGITTAYYSFNTTIPTAVIGAEVLQNLITPSQKARAREIFEIYSSLTGIEFVELDETLDPRGRALWVITGDLRAVNPTPGGAAGISEGTLNGKVIMGIHNNFPSETEFGGSWFDIAFHEIGHSLGLDHSYELPSVQGAGLGATEGVSPGDHDLVHLRRLLRPDSTDIDLYKFNLAERGRLNAEITAERLTPSSLLNSALRLYREFSDGGVVRRELIAQNDDYYSNDSFLDLELEAGTYYIGVSSTGNTDYDPNIAHSGGAGTTDGPYQLKLSFAPSVVAGIVDADHPTLPSTPLDGDADGLPGGAFDFWFEGNTPANTIYVDKANNLNDTVDEGDGTILNPFDTIDAALRAADAASTPDDRRVVRIVGNDANRPYLIGTATTTTGSRRLPDSDSNTSVEADLLVPKDVTVMIDAGAIFKFERARIDVGSSSVGSDRSNGALQVLGTPEKSVFFTSFHNDALGGDSDINPFIPRTRAPGDWGGIVFRRDSGFYEDARLPLSGLATQAQSGVFLNYVNHADITYGGGEVTINGDGVPVSPLELIDARPTISFNVLHDNLQAPISADPHSFDDRLNRIGPDVHGNRIFDNSLDGLFVRIETPFEDRLNRMERQGRFDDTDVVHIITQNLILNGAPGGPIATNTAFAAPGQPATAVARTDGRLKIDPGIIVKAQGARIEAEFGATLIAEGTAAEPVVFTSLADDTFGIGDPTGFDTNNKAIAPAPSNWAGLVFRPASVGSIDHARIQYAGGSAIVPAGSDVFNTIEVHQAQLRLTNSRLEHNASGASSTNRGGLGTNRPATIFVRGAQPVIVNNVIQNNQGSALSINANALQHVVKGDPGRSTGFIGDFDQFGANHGPLVRLNRLGGNGLNGMEVRGGEITTATVWDDTDIVHVLRDEIVVNNLHTFTSVRLQSSETESLVIKLFDTNKSDNQPVGFTANGVKLDIDDRIGGTVQVLGTTGHPVVMTSLADDTVGAGFDFQGRPQTDTNGDGDMSSPAPGDWRSVRLDKLSNDRNVAVILERERPYTNGLDENGTTTSSERLGRLAKDEKSGDENLRLGFEVNGFIALDDPSDVDVYSFEGAEFSEVWIDIDRTSLQLDVVLELLNANGVVVASSIDGVLSGSAGPQDLVKEPLLGGDFYSSNRHDLANGVVFDEGFRVILPDGPNERNNYFIRVRSRPAAGQTMNLEGGLSRGEYQLNVRLRQVDNAAASTVRSADIRYATNGVEVIGIPYHSPLVGESAEAPNDNNNTAGNAHQLGNLLTSDRNVLSVAGRLSSSTDVDWYEFELGYDLIQAVAGVNAGGKSFAAIFDIDYAHALNGGDTILSVFDQNDQLILVARDSDVEDDQSIPGRPNNDAADLRRGSFGNLDPYIGSQQLPAAGPGGTFRYKVAVSSNAQVPSEIDAMFIVNGQNLLARLEPINSLQRVVEDHIGFTGYTSGNAVASAEITPQTGALINIGTVAELDAHIVPYRFQDVQLFVSTAGQLRTVNPFTGQVNYVVNPLGGTNTQDIAMRSDGRLFGADSDNNTANVAGVLVEIDAGTAAETTIGNNAIPNFDPNTNPVNLQQLTSNSIDALAFERVNIGQYDLYYAVRGAHRNSPAAGFPNGVYGGTSTLYRANPANGSAAVVAGQPWGRRGEIFDNTPGDVGITTGMAFHNNGNLYGVSDQGDFYRIDAGSGQASRIANLGVSFAGLSVGPQNVEGGFYKDLLFAITTSGQLFALNVNTGVPQPIFSSPTSNEVQTISAVGAPTGTFTLTFNGQTTQPISADAPATIDVNEVQNLRMVNSDPTGGDFSLWFDANGDTLMQISEVTNPIAFNAPASTSIDEIQTLTLNDGVPANDLPTGGTFTLTFQGETTTPIAFNANAAAVQAALEGLNNIDPGDVAVSGSSLPAGPLSIRFTGQYDGANVNQMTADSSALTGGTSPNAVINTQQNGLASVRQRLEELAAFNPGDLFVQGGPLGATSNFPVQITFTGQYAGRNVPELVPVHNMLVDNDPAVAPNPAADVDTVRDGKISILTALEALANINPGDIIVSGGPLPGTPITVQFVGQYAGQNVANMTVDNTNLVGGAVQVMADTFTTAGAGATFISTGGGATGLGFSPLDFNLWHPTLNRSGDPGHGINPAFDNSRSGNFSRDISTGAESISHGERTGGVSMYFGFEENFRTPLDYSSSSGEAQYGILTEAAHRDLASNPEIGNTPAGAQGNYNLPGGAFGALETNPFSLKGYGRNDKPTLYFNYYLETQEANSSTDTMRDSARVYISRNDGVTWELVATNNSNLDAELPPYISTSRDELPNGGPRPSPRQQVQELFDHRSNDPDTEKQWRQARVDLADYADEENLRLRFEFHTGGEFGNGDARTEAGDLSANNFGNFFENDRGLDNNHEGFYIDDIIVGFAERGEMVTGATAGETGFFNKQANSRTQRPAGSATEVLTGPYQLEIRRGEEYIAPLMGAIGNPILPTAAATRIAPGLQFDTNDRLVQSRTLEVVAAGIDINDGQFFTLNDGVHAVTFEFNKPGGTPGVAAGRVPVNITNASEPADVATAIAAAVNGVNTTLPNLTPDFVATATSIARAASHSLAVQPLNNRVHLNDIVSVTGFEAFGSVTTFDFQGDRNHPRDQGHIVIESNQISNVSQFGVLVDAGARDVGNSLPYPGAPRNLFTLNDARLAPGASVVNNVIAFANQGGIHFSGDANGSNTIPQSVIPYGRVVNNTIVGGFTQVGGPAEADIVFLFDTSGSMGGDITEVRNNLLSLDQELMRANVDARYGLVTFPDRHPSNTPTQIQDLVDFATFTAPGSPFLSFGVVGAAEFGSQAVLEGLNAAVPGTTFNFRPGARKVLILITDEFDNSPNRVAEFQAANAEVLAQNALVFGIIESFNAPFDQYNQLISNSGGQAFDIDAFRQSPGPFFAGFTQSLVGAVAGGAAGGGVVVDDNARPTIINNVFSRLNAGIVVAANSSLTEASHNLYQEAPTAANLIDDDDFVLAPDAVLFRDPAVNNFYLVPGVPAIDSALDVLEEPAQLTAVKLPLGIPRSNIFAPERDVFGQLRRDIVGFEAPGFGANVFKDRGAVERADDERPFAELLQVEDNDVAGVDIDSTDTVVALREGLVDRFRILVGDGLGPEFSFRGTGVDPRTVTSDAVRIRQDGRTLQEGVDYTFGFNASAGIIELTPLTGIWDPNSIFTIDLNNRREFTLTAPNGATVTDGQQFLISDERGALATFEYESGYTLVVPRTLELVVSQLGGGPGGVTDGQTFTLTDGTLTVTFEFDSNNLWNNMNVRVPFQQVPNASSPNQIAGAIAEAIRTSGLSMFPRSKTDAAGTVIDANLPDGVVHLGSTSADSVVSLPMMPASITERGVEGGVDDGQYFTIRNGNVTGGVITFEFDADGVLNFSNSVRIPLLADPSQPPSATNTANLTNLEIAARVVAAINARQAELNLTAVDLLDGRVHLGGRGPSADLSDPGHLLDTTATAMTQVGTPGVEPNFAIHLPGGRRMRLPQEGGAIGGVRDGESFTVSDGVQTVTFEFDADQSLSIPGATAVPFAVSPAATDAATLALTIQTLIANAGFASPTITTDAQGRSILALGGANETLGTSGADSLFQPFDPGLIADGEQFTIGDGTNTVVFEFDNNNASTVPVANRIQFASINSADDILNAIRTAIINANLRFTAADVVKHSDTESLLLDADALHTLDTTPTSLSQTGAAGGAVPVEFIPSDLPQFTPSLALARAIHESIRDTPLLSGVGLELDRDRIIVEGVLSVTNIPTSIAEPILDLAGNPIRHNRPDLSTRFSITMPGVEFDFGDAPTAAQSGLVASYPTLLSADGARHAIVSDNPLRLGATVDAEDDGQPTAAADGDNDDGVAFDGAISISPLVENTVTVTASANGFLDAWIDFNRNGVWEANEKIFDSVAVDAGVNLLTFSATATAVVGDTFARFRLSSQGGLAPTSLASDGEVEDYLVSLVPNVPPVAGDDQINTDEDTVASAAAPGLLTNDTDANMDAMTIVQVNGDAANVGADVLLPSGAIVRVNADGSYVYDPNSAFDFLTQGATAQDSFTYRVSDGTFTDTATVNVTITGVNDAPIATPNEYTTDENTSVSGNVITDDTGLGTDSDPEDEAITVTAVNGAAIGGGPVALPSGALLTINPDGAFTYNPAGAFEFLAEGDTQDDTFTYTLTDATGGSTTATVTVTVSGVNNGPEAVDNVYTTDENTSVSGNVITDNTGQGVDSDPDAGDMLTVGQVNGSASNVGTTITLASGATLTVDASGGFTYDPSAAFDNLAPGQTANDSFTYTVLDGSGVMSQAATVTMTITGVNDPPITQPDAAATTSGVEVDINVLSNDTDPDSLIDPASVQVVTQPVGGLATANADGTITYLPDLDFEGVDTFTYQVADQTGAVSAPTTVSVTVTQRAHPWQNGVNPLDVNGDNMVTILDALIVINTIRDFGTNNVVDLRNTPGVPPANRPPFVDPTGDDLVTVGDVLPIIQDIRARIEASQGEPEGESSDASGLRLVDSTGVIDAGAVDGAFPGYHLLTDISAENYFRRLDAQERDAALQTYGEDELLPDNGAAAALYSPNGDWADDAEDEEGDDTTDLAALDALFGEGFDV